MKRTLFPPQCSILELTVFSFFTPVKVKYSITFAHVQYSPGHFGQTTLAILQIFYFHSNQLSWPNILTGYTGYFKISPDLFDRKKLYLLYLPTHISSFAATWLCDTLTRRTRKNTSEVHTQKRPKSQGSEVSQGANTIDLLLLNNVPSLESYSSVSLRCELLLCYFWRTFFSLKMNHIYKSLLANQIILPLFIFSSEWKAQVRQSVKLNLDQVYSVFC